MMMNNDITYFNVVRRNSSNRDEFGDAFIYWIRLVFRMSNGFCNIYAMGIAVNLIRYEVTIMNKFLYRYFDSLIMLPDLE